MSRRAVILLPAALLLAPLAGCSGPDHPGREPFERACAQCHALEKPLSLKKDREGWSRTVDAMRRQGARLSDEEARAVIDYLAAVRSAR